MAWLDYKHAGVSEEKMAWYNFIKLIKKLEWKMNMKSIEGKIQRSAGSHFYYKNVKNVL